LEIARLVRAVRLPRRLPDRARDPPAWRDGGSGSGPSRHLRARRPPSSPAAPPDREQPPPRGGGGLVRSARNARPRRRPAALRAGRVGDARGSEPPPLGRSPPREPPDAATADRDDAVLQDLRGRPVAVEARVETLLG